MLLIVITFLLIAVGVVAYWYGAWKLSRYAARVSGGLGVGVLLFPPVTFWFTFFKLEQEGKEFPTTMWLFGLVSTILLVIVFWTPLSLVASGNMSQLEKPSGVAATAVAEYGAQADEVFTATPSAPQETPPTPAAATNNAAGTNNAATNAAGTNNVAATNNAPETAAGTTGAPAQ